MLKHTVTRPRALSTTSSAFLEVIPSVFSANQPLRQSSAGAATRGVVKAAAAINVGREMLKAERGLGEGRFSGEVGSDKVAPDCLTRARSTLPPTGPLLHVEPFSSSSVDDESGGTVGLSPAVSLQSGAGFVVL
jgi:hypothetical protein